MTLEQNKQLASELFNRLSTNDVKGALDLMSDDSTWWIAGKRDQLPAAGVYSKERIGRMFRNMTGQLPHGIKMTVKSMIAEGDKVAAEVESYGELSNGRVYNQVYHFALTLRDEKISSIREYLDTQHVFAIWFAE